MRSLRSTRLPTQLWLVWTWGRSDAEIEKAIADLHPGPDDIVLPVTWQRWEAAGETAPKITLGHLVPGAHPGVG